MEPTTTRKNLLVELLVEELPPKALKKLSEAFAGTLADGLRKHGLASGDAAVTSFATPRRLAVHVETVAPTAADRDASQKLMPVSVGLDASGNATPALLKKLQTIGVDASVASQLRRERDGKSESLFLDSKVRGATLAEGLQKALDDAVSRLPIPKVMSYQLDDGWTTVGFVRPAHGLVALHGADVVPVSVLGLNAGRTTHGHRFEARIDPILLNDADSYALQLESEGAVIASFDDRRAAITRQLDDAAARENLKPITDDALLDEVTALVERPNVLVCAFEKEYLEVPPECLILTMKANQKYFPLLDAAVEKDGKLTSKFLVVSNIDPSDPSRVIEGNERVVRPRLADAKFFFDQDRKKTLASRVESLGKVVYHNKLGTQRDRVERVRAIARAIGRELGGERLAESADRAAFLAKADLVTDMVGEFPELQGIMGRYYALHDGEPDEVADAIEDHYRPRFAGDGLPGGQAGVVVALADKLETLTGMFGVGEIPTGDRDPFALRRHALGVIRLVIEKNLDLDVDQAVGTAARQHSRDEIEIARIVEAVVDFIWGRLAFNLREQGVPPQEIEAVLARRGSRLRDIPKKLEAVSLFARMSEAPSLASANKRVRNILNKSADAWGRDSIAVELLAEPAERDLYARLKEISARSEALFTSGDYAESLSALAALKVPVDAFFDSVMVNADDPALRNNRLALLARLHSAMNRVADLSKLAA